MRLLAISVERLDPSTGLGAAVALLRENRYTTFVAAPPGIGASAASARAQFAASGWLPLRQGTGMVALILNTWAVRRWVTEIRPDVLLAAGTTAGVIANAARGRTGGQTVSVVRLDDLPPATGWLESIRAARTIQASDRLLVPDAELRDRLVSRGARRADTLVAPGPADVVVVCQQLEREIALLLPLPEPAGEHQTAATAQTAEGFKTSEISSPATRIGRTSTEG